MTDYEEQALQFLSSTDSCLKLKYLENTINKEWDDRYPRDKWWVFLVNPKGSLSFPFWYHGNEHWPNDPAPSAYDILSTLDPFVEDSFRDFCTEFGYQTYSDKARRIFNECRRISEKLSEMYTSEELEQLAQIN